MPTHTPNPPPVARVHAAGKVYRAGDSDITALHPVDMQVNPGEFLLIMGPSGSGKTTLLSLLGCVIYPTKGQVWVNGQEASRMTETELANLRLTSIGFVFQNFNLIAPLNAEENVMLPLKLLGKSRKEARERATEVLTLLGVAHRRRNLPKQMSGGEQQRVSIARALAADAPLLLCDEPTASLDPTSAKVVMEELKRQSHSGKAVAVVTHDLRLEPYADRIVYVREGRLYAEAPAEGLHH